MTVSPEDFAALARSSPWRWSTLRFTLQRGDVRYPPEGIRAWVRRPDALRVENPEGAVLATSLGGAGRGSGVPLASSALAGMPAYVGFFDDGMTSPSSLPLQDAEAAGPVTWTAYPGDATQPTGRVGVPLSRAVPRRDPGPGAAPQGSPLPEPTFRPDGLVAARPEGESIGDLDDPFYENYYWIALLDPKELADGRDWVSDAPGPGTVIRDVTEVDHYGRPAWQAYVTPTSVYQARCGCCSLLRHRATDVDEWGEGHDALLAEYPSAYRARLDVETGVCVLLEACDGSVAGTGHDLVIEAVDEPMDDGLFRSV